MKEILYLISQKLDHLTLVLIKAQDTHTLSDSKKTLSILREVAGDQCGNIAEAIYVGLGFANTYVELLDVLSEQALGDRTIRHFAYIYYNAGFAVQVMENIHKEMNKFRQEIGDAFRWMGVAMSNSEFLHL